MIYCCENCGFLFRRVGEVRACPFCEGYRFRSATQEEAEMLQSRLETTDDNFNNKAFNNEKLVAKN